MARMMQIVIGVWTAALLGNSPLLAEPLAELYQKALMAEKGEGKLDKAIGFYKDVVDKGSDDPLQKGLAARAQIRLGLCQEKLGLEKASAVYIEMSKTFSDQPQAIVAAAKQLRAVEFRRQQLDGQGLERRRATSQVHFGNGGVVVAELNNNLEGMAKFQAEMAKSQLELNELQLSLGAFSHSTHNNGARYESYAYTPPQIPYSHTAAGTVPLQWSFMVDLSRDAIHAHKEYTEAKFDDSSWSKLNIGQAWEDQGYANFDGGGWYRTTIELDADPKKPVYMAFGGVDEHGYVYINGKQVGAHHTWNRPFILDISKAVKHQGKNTIAIFVHDSAGMGGIYGLIDIHQPDDQEQARPFVANLGGSLNSKQRSFTYRNSGPKAHEQYLRRRPPHIPYPYQSVAEVPDQWKFNLDLGAGHYNHNANYARANYDDSNWSKIDIGLAWENQGYPDYDKGAWYRTSLKIDADPKKPVYMAFGGIDNDAWVYVNGKLVGEHHVWNRPFTLDISNAVKHKGKNTIAIRVFDGVGLGGIRGLIDIHQPKDKKDLSQK